MIDVIIPAYNAHDYILEVLYSIVSQSVSNLINVYIVDDCSVKNYNNEVNKVNKIINVKEIRTPKNLGPGGARQYGIDNSNSKYIIFIDADDLFNDGLSVESLYTSINSSEECDVVISNFIEQTKGKFSPHYGNDIWMHGKIYRRSFLEKYNIKFNNSRANEDTGFNKLAFMVAKLGYLKSFTYIWRYKSDSITRINNHEYRFTGLEGYLFNIEWAVKEAEKKHFPKKQIAKIVYDSFIFLYFDYIDYLDDKDKKNKILYWSINLKNIFLKYQKDLSEEDNNNLLVNAINRGINKVDKKKYLYNESSFNTYIKLIDAIENKKLN